MTLGQIMELALRQLDEDISDIAEFDVLFRRYANEGYVTAQRRYYHPRDTIILSTDENGCASIDGMGIVRVLELHNDAGFKVPYEVSPDGRKIRARLKEEELYKWTKAAEKRRAEIDAAEEKASDMLTLLDALPPGQRKQLLKDETCAAILHKYGITE